MEVKWGGVPGKSVKPPVPTSMGLHESYILAELTACSWLCSRPATPLRKVLQYWMPASFNFWLCNKMSWEVQPLLMRWSVQSSPLSTPSEISFAPISFNRRSLAKNQVVRSTPGEVMEGYCLQGVAHLYLWGHS